MSEKGKITSFRPGTSLGIRPNADRTDWEVILDGRIVTGYERLQILGAMAPWFAKPPTAKCRPVQATVTDVRYDSELGPGIVVTLKTKADLIANKPQANYEIRGIKTGRENET